MRDLPMLLALLVIVFVVFAWAANLKTKCDEKGGVFSYRSQLCLKPDAVIP
jgi:hypothetical protein